MKYAIVLSILAWTFITSNCAGQTKTSTNRFGIGILGGTQVLGKINQSQKLGSATGLVAGLDIGYILFKNTRNFSLHLQPHWSNYKRTDEEGSTSSYRYLKYTWKSSSINLPLVFRYTFSAGQIRPYVELGPSLRFRTAFSVRTAGHSCGVIRCDDLDGQMDYQSTTTKDLIGLTGGVGAEIDIWKVTIPVSVRLNESLGGYHIKTSPSDPNHYESFKTRSIQIVTGITF